MKLARAKFVQRRIRRGLTLIEALASILVLSIAIPSIMEAISVSTRLAGATRHRAEATALADSKLAEVIGTTLWQGGDTAGDFGDEGPGYRWEAHVIDWQEANMEEIRVVVSWTDDNALRNVAVSTLVYTGNSGATTQTASAAGGALP